MSDQRQPPSNARVCIAISTLGARADAIVLPPETQGLSYVILVQGSAAGPLAFERADVTCVMLESTGLSHSRNAALDHCSAPYLLVSDDDLTLDVQGILALADVLDDMPELAFVAGWRKGRALPAPHRVRWYNAGHICAPELMIRRAPIKRAGLRFDPRFGVGAAHPIGEDFIFVCDILGAGLQGRSVPVVTGAHHGASSGEIWDDPRVLSARKAMLRRCFGPMGRVVQMIYGIRMRRHFATWRAAACFAFTR